MLVSRPSPVEGEDTYGVGKSIAGLGKTDKTQEQVHAVGKTQDRGNSKSQKAITSTCEGLGKSNPEAKWFDLIAAWAPPEKTERQPNAVLLSLWKILRPEQ